MIMAPFLQIRRSVKLATACSSVGFGWKQGSAPRPVVVVGHCLHAEGVGPPVDAGSAAARNLALIEAWLAVLGLHRHRQSACPVLTGYRGGAALLYRTLALLYVPYAEAAVARPRLAHAKSAPGPHVHVHSYSVYRRTGVRPYAVLLEN